MKKGKRVRFNVRKFFENYNSISDDPNSIILGDPTAPIHEVARRLQHNPDIEASVTGTVYYGDYINLRFDDGFEFGVSKELIGREQ